MIIDGNVKIVDFIEDKGKDKDGRLVVQLDKSVKKYDDKFLKWLGQEFIKQGGLYAVDICIYGVKKIYRVSKNKGEWI